jgi:hypothetical protein
MYMHVGWVEIQLSLQCTFFGFLTFNSSMNSSRLIALMSHCCYTHSPPLTMAFVIPWEELFCSLLPCVMRWAGNVARMGEGRGAYRILVGRPEGRRPLGRRGHRWGDNISMDLQVLGVGGGGHGLDSSGSKWGQVLGCCECGNEPLGFIKCGEFID